MQAKAFILYLSLAASVAAVPARPRDNNSTTEGSFNGIGSDNENNPALGTGNANHNGNGNSFGSDNESENDFLNDFLNFSNGADSRQVSEDVVAALQSLTLTCTPSSEGIMSCTWTKS